MNKTKVSKSFLTEWGMFHYIKITKADLTESQWFSGDFEKDLSALVKVIEEFDKLYTVEKIPDLRERYESEYYEYKTMKNLFIENYKNNFNAKELLDSVKDVRNMYFETDAEEEKQANYEYAKLKRYIDNQFGFIDSKEYDNLMGKVRDKLWL